MNKLMRLFCFLFSFVFFVGCGSDKKNIKEDEDFLFYEQQLKIQELWSVTVSPLLISPLWIPEYNYDAGQLLMTPLHYSFITNNTDYINDFDVFFETYSSIVDESIDEGSRLRHLQFWYLLSQYLILSNNTDNWKSFHNKFIDVMLPYITDVWKNRPISALGMFSIGLKGRVELRNSGVELDQTFHSAVFDEEHFFYAIASDLYFLREHINKDHIFLLEDILITAKKVYKKEFIFIGDRVLFQPGAWRDHIDYQYAGNQYLAENLQPIPIDNIALDSSHSHRFPLWLGSLIRADNVLDPSDSFYSNVLDAFEKQFIQFVYVPISNDFSGMRMNNYMDGNNGVYRYRYSDVSSKLGYGPYGLSGTLLTGFYGFLDNSFLNSEYSKLCNQFPLSDEVLNLYVGLGKTRITHNLTSFPEYFSNGFAELHCRLASQVRIF